MRWLVLLLALVSYAQTAEPPKPPAESPNPAVEVPISAPPPTFANAIAKQREASRRQALSVGAHLTPWAEPGAEAAEAICDALADSVVSPFIQSAAKQHGLEVNVIRAVITQESAFHACAVSPSGAQGLMQLMPATANQLGVYDSFDPQQNIEGGAKYLKQLLDKYKGDLALALGAYNAGPAEVDKVHGIPNFPETRAYVEAVMQKAGVKRTDPPSSPKPTPTGN